MTTGRQINTNRANAERSTGPRSTEGKARSARNALKHGAYGQRLAAIPRGAFSENEGELRQFVAEVVEALAPRDALEREHALRIAMAYVRLRRIGSLEALSLAADGQLEAARFSHVVGADLSPQGQSERAAKIALKGTMETVTRLEARVTQELDRALLLYARLQERPMAEQTQLPR